MYDQQHIDRATCIDTILHKLISAHFETQKWPKGLNPHRGPVHEKCAKRDPSGLQVFPKERKTSIGRAEKTGPILHRYNLASFFKQCIGEHHCASTQQSVISVSDVRGCMWCMVALMFKVVPTVLTSHRHG